MGDIRLRPITYDDTELIVKWRNQEDVRSRFFYREEFTRSGHERWMQERVMTGQVVQFIIIDSDGDTPLGSTYLRDIDYINGTAEYGVFIGDSRMRGKGIGKKALRMTLDYAWNELGLKTIRARAMTDNEASVRAFLSTGFKIITIERSVICSDGEKKDMLWMGIDR